TDYETWTTGTRTLAAGAAQIKVLVEASNLGSDEVEMAEATFPVGYRTAGHSHGAIELFYVVEGVLEHVVNGKAQELVPGMVGIVRPEDTVVHAVVGDTPVKALVVWAPGGEAERLADAFARRRSGR
ncbi:MAG: cupin domain-containing protein, partial [Pseudomonadales bacterium]